jgi:pentatricopeptide repeat protein
MVPYNTVIDGLGKKKTEIAKAMDILGDMISKRLQPHVVTYSTLESKQ